MKERGRGSTFEDLEVYRAAREFRKTMYRVTRGLPDIEKFGLAGQIRRAAVSLTNNIAEGHGRYHFLEQIKFTLHSRGSIEELIDDLNVCDDEQYLAVEEIASLKQCVLATTTVDRWLYPLLAPTEEFRTIFVGTRNGVDL
jgi:four helix bundle protein